MSTITTPGENSPTFKRVKEHARLFYGWILNYDDYVAICEKVATPRQGRNFFEVQVVGKSPIRDATSFAVWFNDQWVACLKPKSAYHVTHLQEPAVLDEFRASRLHYREPISRQGFKETRHTAQDFLGWEYYEYGEWIESCERIRRYETMPGVKYLENEGKYEVWAVNKQGKWWHAFVWDRDRMVIIDIRDKEVLYKHKIIEREVVDGPTDGDEGG
jgi:hypothetical protein